MTPPLEGKVALITGGCSGIGLAGVEAFLEAGARVVCADIQDSKGATLAGRFAADRFVYLHCDVTLEAEVEAAVRAAADRFGGLDVLWNNAGACTSTDGIESIDLVAFEFQMRLLVTSVVAGTKHAIPYMKQRGGGSIINTASMGALQVGHAPFAYCTAKAAVKWMTSVNAVELAPHNIRVNSLCPGYIATSAFGVGMGLPVEQADQLAALASESFSSMQPLRRPGLPSDIASSAVFLASDASRFITGHALVVDGGISLAPPHTWMPDAPPPIATALGLTG